MYRICDQQFIRLKAWFDAKYSKSLFSKVRIECWFLIAYTTWKNSNPKQSDTIEFELGV